MSRPPIPISSALDGVVHGLRGPDRRAVSGVFGRWEEIVGTQIATHVQPVQLDEAVLIVAVDDPGWATEMKFLAAQIREQLRDRAGVIVERIEVRVDRRNSRGQRDRHTG